jgi:Carboxypeptidase regulatory-like domain
LIQNVLKRFGAVCALGSAIFLGSPTPLAAQTNTAVVAGTVLDQAGQLLPNATVSIKNEATGAVRTAVTGADGHFKADGVPHRLLHHHRVGIRL